MVDYKKAKKIREKSITDLALDKMAAGSSTTGAIGRAISDKVKAKAVGMVEKVDPMNIVKFMTFGSKLATGAFGKLTGRKQENIDYFTGRKTKKAGTATRLVGYGGGQLDGSATQILTQIYDFMVESYDEDKQIREIQRGFQEEKDNENQRRHEEFVNKLKEFVEIKSQPEIRVIGAGGQKEPGVLSKIGSYFESFATGVKNLLTNITSFVTNLFEYLASTVVAGMLATFFGKMKKWLITGLGFAFRSIFNIIPKIFDKLLWETLARMFGSALLSAFRLFANPVVLGALAALATGYLIGKTFKDFTESETSLRSAIGASENEKQRIQRQLDALPPPRGGKIVNGELVEDDPYAFDRKNYQRLIKKEDDKIAIANKKLDAVQEAKVATEGVQGLEKQTETLDLLDRMKNFLSGKTENVIDYGKDIGDKIGDYFDGAMENITPDFGDMKDKLKLLQPHIDSFPLIDNKLFKSTDENNSLNLDRNFGEQISSAGDVVNQNITTTPTVTKQETPASATVRDSTQIFKRVFDNSVVAV